MVWEEIIFPYSKSQLFKSTDRIKYFQRICSWAFRPKWTIRKKWAQCMSKTSSKNRFSNEWIKNVKSIMRNKIFKIKYKSWNKMQVCMVHKIVILYLTNNFYWLNGCTFYQKKVQALQFTCMYNTSLICMHLMWVWGDELLQILHVLQL